MVKSYFYKEYTNQYNFIVRVFEWIQYTWTKALAQYNPCDIIIITTNTQAVEPIKASDSDIKKIVVL